MYHFIGKACRHNTGQTIEARIAKLGILSSHAKWKTPIDFEGQRSKVKVIVTFDKKTL